MKLQELERHWDEFGRTDPMWAILTDGAKAGNRWDAREFFASGRGTVENAMRRAAELRLPTRAERALDFGCGLGRLTQALAAFFASVDGVDIAQSMIQGARYHNRCGARVAYHVNTCGELALFEDESFDLVYSYQVLQHIHPQHSLKFVLEFVRVLRKGGLICVQLPSRTLPPPPLPPQAYVAEIVPAGGPLSAAAGEKLTVQATVRNISPVAWPLRSGGRDTFVRLGNHWHGTAGVVAFDDGRVALPRDLASGEAATVDITVTAPKVPGSYALELDLVQENVCWFAQRGSPTARVAVDVAAAGVAEAPQKPGAVLVPRMEMHPVPEPVVIGLLEAAGARVVAVDHNDGGPYESCTYLATR